jgi:CRP-like cAMP-binding protein
VQSNNPEDVRFSSSNDSIFQKLSSAAKEEIIKLSEIWRYEQQDSVLEADEYSEHVYFISTGSLLSYEERDGEKIVKWVRSAGDFAFAQKADLTTAALEKQLTGQIIVALEDTNVIRISFENMKRLRDKHSNIDILITQEVIGSAFIDHWLQTNRYLPPKRKYEFVQARVRFDLNKVPDIYLASWLGITLGELKDVRNSINR